MLKPMEESLATPLGDVLQTLQDRIMTKTSYFGIPTLKCPLDYWVYQEIIYEYRPDFILEIGNFMGGSTLALAHICDLLGHGQVIGLDINHSRIEARVRQHSRITLLEGDACAQFARVQALIGRDDAKVIVIEDSSHTYENTLKVLRTYSRLIQLGGHFIVEDSICHHGLALGPSPGPYEAIETFLAEDSRFVTEREKESFQITWNPKGFLKRIA